MLANYRLQLTARRCYGRAKRAVPSLADVLVNCLGTVEMNPDDTFGLPGVRLTSTLSNLS